MTDRNISSLHPRKRLSFDFLYQLMNDMVHVFEDPSVSLIPQNPHTIQPNKLHERANSTRGTCGINKLTNIKAQRKLSLTMTEFAPTSLNI